MPRLFLFILFCFFLHACNGRVLVFSDKGVGKHVELSANTDVSKDESYRSQGPLERSFLFDSLKENQEAIQDFESIKISGQSNWKKPVRSMLGSPTYDSEEAVSNNTEQNGAVEDIVVMDYAQPHRKPPIHNEKP